MLFYEGTVWYHKKFRAKPKADKNYFLYFGAANYRKVVYINGQRLGEHEGGFTPFQFEVSEHLREGKNVVVVKVDNSRRKEDVPNLQTDWWNYGGLTRDVLLIETPQTYIQDYFLHLDPQNPRYVQGYVQLKGNKIEQQEVNIKIAGTRYSTTLQTDQNGRGSFRFKASRLERWSVKNPKRYKVQLNTAVDTIIEQLGFRTVEIKGRDILINGHSTFLRGICYHNEIPESGRRASTESDCRSLLNKARALNTNFCRLGHYPHPEFAPQIADQMGQLLWEEIPVYWSTDWDNEETFEVAMEQLTALIHRDKNRASVIIWSMANETPKSEARLDFLKKMVDFTKAHDPTRIVSAALLLNWDRLMKEKIASMDDPFSDYVDMVAVNEYLAWYGERNPPVYDKVEWELTSNKPLMHSECGGGALYGLPGDSSQLWTEVYQAWLYKELTEMLARQEELRGVTPWILNDFRSPRRMLADIQDGWNRKGLLSEKGDKKAAWYTLKAFYDKMEKRYPDK